MCRARHAVVEAVARLDRGEGLKEVQFDRYSAAQQMAAICRSAKNAVLAEALCHIYMKYIVFCEILP